MLKSSVFYLSASLYLNAKIESVWQVLARPSSQRNLEHQEGYQAVASFDHKLHYLEDHPS